MALHCIGLKVPIPSADCSPDTIWASNSCIELKATRQVDELVAHLQLNLILIMFKEPLGQMCKILKSMHLVYERIVGLRIY